MGKNKKTILIDIDGVLNNYNGIYKENFIPTIKEGAIDFLKTLSKSYNLVLFTSRNLLIASQWAIDNKIEKYISNITNIKEPCFLIIDDRCINFKGDFASTIKEIQTFKVWYK